MLVESKYEARPEPRACRENLWQSLRTPERILVCFFGYIVCVSLWLSRPLSLRPVLIFAALIGVMLLLVLTERNIAKLGKIIAVARNWIPLALTYAAFREMDVFQPKRFDHIYESAWIRWDVLLLNHWHLRPAIEGLGAIIPSYLELCYLLVYAIGAFGVATLYCLHGRKSVDRFLTIYLIGTLLAYAMFPFFPSQPPRILYPHLDAPSILTPIRAVNLWLLRNGSIHSSVFPSAHVSSAFSAAWAFFLILPWRKWFGWGMLAYALSVSIATVYGRYHYAADVLAGFGVSLVPGLICLFLKRSGKGTDAPGGTL